MPFEAPMFVASLTEDLWPDAWQVWVGPLVHAMGGMPNVAPARGLRLPAFSVSDGS